MLTTNYSNINMTHTPKVNPEHFQKGYRDLGIFFAQNRGVVLPKYIEYQPIISNCEHGVYKNAVNLETLTTMIKSMLSCCCFFSILWRNLFKLCILSLYGCRRR